MCILFLLVGDNTRPTLICNNRDEYFDRKTVRGNVDQDGDAYAPLDVEGGGSWIFTDGLSGKKSGMRYSIVLNFHHWREKYPFGPNPLPRRKILMTSLRSRGHLAKNFMNSTYRNAEDYARFVYSERSLYRPFNLVVSDSSGTYYISSSLQQQMQERLIPGRLYAISNGYLHDAWDKTNIGKYFIDLALVSELKVCSRESACASSTGTGTSPTDISTIALNASKLAPSALKPVAQKLAEVMQTDTPLADPTFGRRSMPAMHVCSIFVRPTIILRRPLLQSVYLAKQFFIEIIALWLHALNLIVAAVLGTGKRRSGAVATRTWAHALRHWMHSAIALSHFQAPSYVRLGNNTNWLLPDADMFGTRTITIICHIPGALPATPATEDTKNDQDRKAAAPPASAVEQEEDRGDKAPTATCAGSASAYYILERDLDTERMEWSDQEFCGCTHTPPLPPIPDNTCPYSVDMLRC
jgi:uncharacterized protein with NRDE domain